VLLLPIYLSSLAPDVKSLPIHTDKTTVGYRPFNEQGFRMFYTQFKSVLTGLIVALALSSVLASASAVAETRYYPTGNPNPLEVGTEEYLENYASLAGLEGVRVITSYVFGSAKKYKFNDMKTDLVPQIRQRLEDVGLRMLSAEELKTTPGQPTLTFFPAYSGNEIDAIKANSDPEAAAKPSTTDAEHDCCRSSIWASFQQSSSILRDPNTQYMFSTWGSGEDTDSCEDRGAWTYDAVLKTIDKFVDDYKKAESERQPKLVSNATEVPENCAQAWLMNLNVFETNKTVISEAVKPILDELAETAARCDRYSYLIETHADKRADDAYNKVLSEARAHAIKDYLLRKNINYNRLKTIAYGESKPLSQGTSEQDHAVNRRVVIIPQRDQS